MSGNGATGDSLALERLILEHEWAGALPLAADLMAQGSSDARRWYGLCQWQLGNTNEAELALRECVSLGDMAVSLYIIALACDQGVDVDLHDPQLTWVRTEIGTAKSEEICGRIAVAFNLISNTDASVAFTDLMLPILDLGCSQGSVPSLSLMRALLDGEIEVWAEDAGTSPGVLNAITLTRTGMSAWTACTNPSLSESTASRIIAGDRESLIRAISSNTGLESSTREQAKWRLAEIERGISDSEGTPRISSLNPPPPPSAKHFGTPDNPKVHLLQLLRSDRTSEAHALSLEIPDVVDEETSVALALADIAWQEQFGPHDFSRARRLLDSVEVPARTYVGLIAPLHRALLAIRSGEVERNAVIEGLTPHLERVVDYSEDVQASLVYALRNLVAGLAEASSMSSWLGHWEHELAQLTSEAIDAVPSIAGDAAVELGDLAAAERHFRLAMKSSPTQVAGHAANSLAFSVLIPLERWDEAEEVLIPLMGSPDLYHSMNARSNLGQVAYLRGEPDRAQRLLTRVHDYGMELLAESTYFLAKIALDKGDDGSAQSMFELVASTQDDRYAAMAKVALDASFGGDEGTSPKGEFVGKTELTLPASIYKRLLRETEDGDMLACNDLGYRLLEVGQREEGLTWLERSARAGVPSALANFNWRLLLDGDHERAVILFDEAREACETFVRKNVGNTVLGIMATEQLANARSNDALNRLALGGPFIEALTVWSLGSLRGHIESKFYPAIIALREGHDIDAASITSRLTAIEHSSVLHDMETSVTESLGWFKEWCDDGLRLLTPDLLDAVSPVNIARFCGSCGTPRTPTDHLCGACFQAF